MARIALILLFLTATIFPIITGCGEIENPVQSGQAAPTTASEEQNPQQTEEAAKPSPLEDIEIANPPLLENIEVPDIPKIEIRDLKVLKANELEIFFIKHTLAGIRELLAKVENLFADIKNLLKIGDLKDHEVTVIKDILEETESVLEETRAYLEELLENVEFEIELINLVAEEEVEEWFEEEDLKDLRKIINDTQRTLEKNQDTLEGVKCLLIHTRD